MAYRNNILHEIYCGIEGSNYSYDFSCKANKETLDKQYEIIKNGCNCDIQVTIEQTCNENIYFNLTLYDYNTKEKIDLGYIYSKNFRGFFDVGDGKFLVDLYKSINKMTERLFNTKCCLDEGKNLHSEKADKEER